MDAEAYRPLSAAHYRVLPVNWWHHWISPLSPADGEAAAAACCRGVAEDTQTARGIMPCPAVPPPVWWGDLCIPSGRSVKCRGYPRVFWVSENKPLVARFVFAAGGCFRSPLHLPTDLRLANCAKMARVSPPRAASCATVASFVQSAPLHEDRRTDLKSFLALLPGVLVLIKWNIEDRCRKKRYELGW